MIAATSIESYLALRTEGREKNQLLVVLNHLKRNPLKGFTRNELSRILGLSIQSICGRIGTLKDEGLVIEDTPRKDPITGRSGKPVRIAPDILTH
ncbi:MarR family transcriptional regulator [Burkholderia vietnamiensis]|uniref:MarR family transcriptional regulator n=1 Tax=Burkholderia vietnamiensis TaxID=60552 RepID=UPI001CF57842|nr:helix-turn-helix domain-containing protein [Burkholderia vietnamiensis]MCA8013350.1 MarR family transcriptional regulator [Burkholderia vietnamiensis]